MRFEAVHRHCDPCQGPRLALLAAARGPGSAGPLGKRARAAAWARRHVRAFGLGPEGRSGLDHGFRAKAGSREDPIKEGQSFA